MLKRYFLEISYIGTAYNGWQVQLNAPVTIQAALNEKLSMILQRDIMITGSSRTDAGVHARQNFAHVDLEEEIIPVLLHKLNYMLPDDICVKNIFEVKPEMNSRFVALSRSYEYHLHTFKEPFRNQTSCFYPYKNLDLKAMMKCCDITKQHDDFAAFSKRRTQVKTTICKIETAEWVEDKKNSSLTFYITANRFLRGMVRGLVGTMLRVGRGKLTVDDFEKILLSKLPHKTDFSAPANGLTLMEVKYNWKEILA